MKRTLLSAAAVCFAASTALAGGLLTNTNQNIAFLRNPARGASTQIDAVYSNPAGTVFMPDGLTLSFNVQSAYQTRKIKSTFAPFEGFGGSPTKTFKGTAAAPFVPSLQAVYKRGRWAFMGSFAVTGGGGKATFNHGLPSFESLVAMLPVIGNQRLGTTKYSVDSYMKGRQMIYGIQLGAAYAISKHFSVSAGFRVNYVDNGYEGRITDIKFNPGGGPMVSAHEFLKQAAAQNPALAPLAALTADKYLDCDQGGWGVTPVLGVHFKGGKWNVGVKYEFKTSLNVENRTKRDDTGLFADGVNTPHDIPGLLTVGVEYSILPVLRASAGYHHFFDKSAKMAGDKQKHIDAGTNEYLAGLEWDITKKLLVSAGMQRTKYDLGDNYQSDMSFSLSSYSVGFGAAYDFLPNLRVNIAYFMTIYSDYTKHMADYNNIAQAFGSFGVTPLPGTDVFSRTNKVFGVGIDYRF